MHSHTHAVRHATHTHPHTFIHVHIQANTLIHTYPHTHPHVLSLTRHHAHGLMLTCVPAPAHTLHTHSLLHPYTLPPALRKQCTHRLFSSVGQVQWEEVKQPPGYSQSVPPRLQEGKGLYPLTALMANCGPPAGHLILWDSVSPSVH